MKTAELYRLGRMLASGTVADEWRQSFPLPIRQKNALHVAFLFSPSLATPSEGVKLSPPNYLALLNAATGQLLNLRAVGPGDFGQKHGENDMIGVAAMPADMSVEEFMAKRDRLFDLYDALMPIYAQGSVKSDQDTLSQVIEFSRLFLLLSEPPLLPYYREAGKDFFAWLNRIAK